MVDVEQRALRALEQDALARPAQVLEQRPGPVHIGQDVRRDVLQLGADRLRLDLFEAEAPAQGVVMGEQALDLGVERREIGEVHDADGAAADLVLIGGADAALGRADLGPGGGGILPQRVEFAMQRQDQRRVFGDAQIFARDLDALGAQIGDFLDEMTRIDDDAIADHRKLARAHDAGRQQRQLVDDAVDDQRMAGVVAALKAHHDVGRDRQPVDDLALALVAPLGADHHHIRHSPGSVSLLRAGSPAASLVSYARSGILQPLCLSRAPALASANR